MRLTITVNGRVYTPEIQPDTSLLSLLRLLGFPSVKQGCETGMCGICTVWLDKAPVLSCATPAVRAQGREVTTVEGVREQAAGLGRFLASEGADQCGYCAPGLIMTVLAMARELKSPTEEEIIHYLNGNLCRCTGYAGQLRAVKKYLDARHSKDCGVA